MSIAWISSSISLRFYEIYRFTKFSNILTLAIKQALVFLLLVFAFFGFYGELQEPTIAILKYVVMVMGVVFLIKDLYLLFAQKNTGVCLAEILEEWLFLELMTKLKN